MRRSVVPLADRDASYDAVGATRPQDASWGDRPAGYRGYEDRVRIGAGDADWAAATEAVLRWGVKTRSGFEVDPPPPSRVQPGDRVWLRARVGPVTVREPAVVVSVVDEATRCGFAYGTLDGHPVAGEEAFVVHREPDGAVWLTLRSLTSAPPGPWRLLFPAVLVAQRWYRRRYRRALAAVGRSS